MAAPTPPKKDDQEESTYREYEINLEMWKHYDNLRQEKSKTFLTAQTILIAVSGFVFQSQDLNSALLILAISLLGLGSSVLWFLLLLRNAGYIQFHRERVKKLEPHTGMQFTTFRDKWTEFDKKLWPKSSSITKESSNATEIDRMLAAVFKAFGSSTMIDRMLAALFGLFWLCLSGYSGFLFDTARVYG
jgi:hypothetical protein